jgi:anti-sigma regulatory factor (Ser/Thr protein kinase)
VEEASLARLSLDRRPELAPLARDTARAVAAVVGLTPEASADLELAVGEAVANALSYVDRPTVELLFRREDDRLIIEVLGNVRGFAADERPMPGTSAEHGRGLPLLARLMDHVGCIPVEGGVALRLEKNIS